VTEKEPLGVEVAAHLKRLFPKFGLPLFLKIDNGGNLNHSSIQKLLASNHVLPLNSPAYCAPYNGAIEHTQGEFKACIKECAGKFSSFKEFFRLAEITAHDLNHAARRKLSGKNSCSIFFGKPKRNFNKRKRQEVFQWISELAIDIVKQENVKMLPLLGGWHAVNGLSKTACFRSENHKMCYLIILKFPLIIRCVAHRRKIQSFNFS